MKLFVNTVNIISVIASIVTATSGSAKTSVVQKIPKISQRSTLPGFTYFNLAQVNLPTPFGRPSEVGHWVSINLPSEKHGLVSVHSILPRIVSANESDSRVELFEEELFATLDAISRSRDPLTKTARLLHWVRLASVDHQQLAELHNRSEFRHLGPAVSHRERERFYAKLAFYLEKVLDDMLADKDFLAGFSVGEYRKENAQKDTDYVLDNYIYHLDHQVVPRKPGGLRAKWDEYRFIRKMAKLPDEVRARYSYLSEMIALNDKPAIGLDFAARRALMLQLHSGMGLAIIENISYVNPPYYRHLKTKELMKYAEIDNRLWRELYILQKSTMDKELFHQLTHLK